MTDQQPGDGMKKQPTYVWIVEDNCWEDVPQGVVGVFACKQSAVQHVRQLRRGYRHAAWTDDFGVRHEAIRLRDWVVDTDTQHMFGVSLDDRLCREPHRISAYRREVQR